MDECSYEARKSAPKERVEVTMRPERRRRWSSEEKLRIVRETLRPGAVASVVADQHGIGTGLLYTWRKQMLTCGDDRICDGRGHARTAGTAAPGWTVLSSRACAGAGSRQRRDGRRGADRFPPTARGCG